MFARAFNKKPSEAANEDPAPTTLVRALPQPESDAAVPIDPEATIEMPAMAISSNVELLRREDVGFDPYNSHKRWFSLRLRETGFGSA